MGKLWFAKHLLYMFEFNLGAISEHHSFSSQNWVISEFITECIKYHEWSAIRLKHLFILIYVSLGIYEYILKIKSYLWTLDHRQTQMNKTKDESMLLNVKC